MKAYIYARYSSEKQTEQSIEGQLRDCHMYAAQNHIDIVHEYIDRAISGRTDDRPEFLRMIADCSRREVDAVIVYKTDRFSRDRYHSAMYKAELKKYGVRVLYAKEPIPDGIEGILLESLMEGLAEYYSAELSQKLRRGIRESALKCQTLGGNLALGYKIGADKKFEIDEQTAPIVRKIFEMYAKGLSCVEICDAMNAMGFKTSRGAAFNKNSLRTILKNEKYIGVYIVKDIRIEGGVPAIVDKKLFDTVQTRLAENARVPQHKRAKADYHLSGKLYCGKCGRLMTGFSGTSKTGDSHYYYRCVGRKDNTCDKNNVKKDWIEELVLSETNKHVLSDEGLMNFIAKRCAEISAADHNDNEELRTLKKRLSETEKALNGVMSAIEQGIVTRSTKERLQSLEEQRETIEAELREISQRTPILPENELQFTLKDYADPRGKSPEVFRENILGAFVHQAVLYDDRLVVIYNLAPNGKDFLRSELFSLPSLDSDIKEEGKGLSVARFSPPKMEQSILGMLCSFL